MASAHYLKGGQSDDRHTDALIRPAYTVTGSALVVAGVHSWVGGEGAGEEQKGQEGSRRGAGGGQEGSRRRTGGTGGEHLLWLI